MASLNTTNFIQINTDGGNVIEIHLFPGEDGTGGVLTSDLKYSDGELEFNAAIDGLESFMLALACEGLDVNAMVVRRALETALVAIGNEYA